MTNAFHCAGLAMVIAMACTPVQAENIDQNTFMSKYAQADDFVKEGGREYDVVQPFLDRGDYDSACEHLKASWSGYSRATAIYRELARYDNLSQRTRDSVTNSADGFYKISQDVWDQKEETCKIAASLK